MKWSAHWTPVNELLVITPSSRWVLMWKLVSMDHFVFKPATITGGEHTPMAELTKQEYMYLYELPCKWTSTEMRKTLETYAWMLDDPLSKRTKEQLDKQEFGSDIRVDYETPLVVMPRVKPDGV